MAVQPPWSRAYPDYIKRINPIEVANPSYMKWQRNVEYLALRFSRIKVEIFSFRPLRRLSFRTLHAPLARDATMMLLRWDFKTTFHYHSRNDASL